MTGPPSPTAVPLAARADAAVSASIRRVDGRRICRFEIRGGPHHGAINVRGAATVERAVRVATEQGVPVVGVVDTSGAEVHDGVAALHAWGRIARALSGASGSVPVLMGLVGAAVSGPALLLGLADVVVATGDSFAYVTGPAAIEGFTGVRIDRNVLGSGSVHATTTGVASLLADTPADVDDALATVLTYLPDSSLDEPPRARCDDPPRRRCAVAASTVPARASAAYDVRAVIADVVDAGSALELRARYAPNLVTSLARVAGRAVGVVANQPLHRAGTLDIEASRKAARFVAWCDAFGLPLVTFVDTPGFEPGRDLEWRGMIRHGAELVHAYAAASVPRVCVVLRKAYGGAYIVMDSRGIGNDLCVAWPGAEIAVMGAPGAVQILHGRRLASLDPPARAPEQARLVAEYEDVFSNPYRAAERGYVDDVIAPADTRRVLATALDALATKTTRAVHRRHSNTPL